MQHLLFLAHRIRYPLTKGDKVRSYQVISAATIQGAVHAAGDYHTAPKKVLRAVGASRRMS